jgi:hypothetical protein
MRSPALAIGWEIWARSRVGLMSVIGLVAAGAICANMLRESVRWSGLVQAIAYTLTALSVLVTLGCFHFTEGSRRGGFGSFPKRLFSLPISTRSLVGWPMLYGAGAIVVVYLFCAGVLLRHAGRDLPLLWPSLYLIFGATQFQMILWSLPESRYLKLLCLSAVASIITFGWMFFIPSIIEGALSEWGYTGDPGTFARRLLIGLALTGPAAYLIALSRVRHQRHGITHRAIALADFWEQSIGRLFRRRKPFRSVDHAILWQEWRRSGLVLPIVVVVIFGLTCLPALLSDGLGAQATRSILLWLFVAPFLFALIIGCGYGKPDFWNIDLKIPPFSSIRPVTPGQWLAAKMKVALVSATLSWVIALYLGFLWTVFAGDLEGPKLYLERVRFFYSPAERWLMGAFALPATVVVTWALLVNGLARGMSGSKTRYRAYNLTVGLGLIGVLVLILWRSDNADHSLHLYNLWPLIAWLPTVLSVLLFIKMCVAALAWQHVLQNGLASPRSAALYFVTWLIAVGTLAILVFVLCRHTLWLRHLLMLASFLIVPLTGPPLAMKAFVTNRSNP